MSLGAVGDGIADDTDAFKAAFSHPSNCIFVPRGQFKISRTLVLTDGKHLIGAGPGTVINRDISVAPFHIIEIAGASDIVIEGISIDGIRKENVSKPENRYCGIKIWRAQTEKRPSRIVLNNVTIRRTTSGEFQKEGVAGGLVLADCTDIRVSGFRGDDNRGTSLFLSGETERVLVTDSFFSGEVAPYSETFMAGQPIGSGISGVFKQNLTVTNCIAYGHGYTNLSINGKRAIISNNTSFASQFGGITLGHNSVVGAADEALCQGNIIYGNLLDGISCAYAGNVNVADNLIYGNGRDDANPRSGIRLYWIASANLTGKSHVSIVNNKIYNNGAQGILMEWGIHHVIAGNQIFNNDSAGVYLDGNQINNGSDLNHCTIENNHLMDNYRAIVVAGPEKRQLSALIRHNVIKSSDSSRLQPIGVAASRNVHIQTQGNIFNEQYDRKDLETPAKKTQVLSGAKMVEM